MNLRNFRNRTGASTASLSLLTLTFLAAISTSASAAPGKCDAPIIADQLCEAGKSAADKAGEILTAPVRAAAGGAVDMLTSWVADGAQWLLGKVIGFIDHSTSPNLGTEWFSERYRFMVGLGSLVLLPMLLIASIRAVMNQDLGQLLRSFLVYLPIAIFGTFVAVYLTQTLLAVTDSMSAAVADGVAGDASQIFDSVGKGLGTVGTVAPATPSFAIFFGALFLILGSFFVWLELLVRSAAVTMSVFFLPLMLAGLVWPTTSRWARRLVETLVALILSKFVIVAVISLATAALAEPGGGGFGSVMGGAALMLMAAFSPLALLKLMPMVEGAAVSHLQGVGRKPLETMRHGGSVNQASSIMRSKLGGAGASSRVAMAGAGVTGAAIARGATNTSSPPAGRIDCPSAGARSVEEQSTRPTRQPARKPKVGGAAGSGSSSAKPVKGRSLKGSNDD